MEVERKMTVPTTGIYDFPNLILGGKGQYVGKTDHQLLNPKGAKMVRHKKSGLMTLLAVTLCAVAAIPTLAASVANAGSHGCCSVDDSQWRKGPSEDWFVNWDKALAEAKKTNKALFVLNASGWSPFFARFKVDVLDKPEFLAFARKNLVLVYLDYPRGHTLPKEQMMHNLLIKRVLHCKGTAQAVIANAKGERLGEISGRKLSLNEYMAKLREIVAGKERGTVSSPRDQVDRRLFKEGYSCLAAPGGKSVMVDDSQWHPGPSPDWFINWDKALAEAKRTNKALFLLNTGSDWCVFCKALKANVLDKPQFIEFARRRLVLVYLDSPSRPLSREQAEHNRLIVKSVSFRGGVPNAMVMNAKGEKLGEIHGGALGLDEYLNELRGILGGKSMSEDAFRLLTEGYSRLGAEEAARRAAILEAKPRDFKARVTGVAVVENLNQTEGNGITFLPPDTPIEVPHGKAVLFRVEHDFPKGYMAMVSVGLASQNWREVRKLGGWSVSGAGPIYYTGRGTAFTNMSLKDIAATYTIKSIKISSNSKPELENRYDGGLWEIGNASVNITFLKKE